jgi:hypothetical protein
MGVSAWPFLISRNRQLDYQVLVAPGFLVDAGIAGLLATRVGGDPTESPQYLELSRTKVGRIALFYRIIIATKGERVLRDAASRPIVWIEGLVMRGSQKEHPVSVRDLEEAHKRVEGVYWRFWNETTPVPVERSSAFAVPVAGEIEERRLPLPTEPPPEPAVASDQQSRPSIVPIGLSLGIKSILLLSLVVVAIAGWIRPCSKTPDPLDIQVVVVEARTERPLKAEILVGGEPVEQEGQEPVISLTADQPMAEIGVAAPGYRPWQAVITVEEGEEQLLLQVMLSPE